MNDYLFAHLDQITGDEIAFFALLDPPDTWLEVAQNRDWWQEYQSRVGQSGYSYDDIVLVQEIARLFQVEWKQFPVLVISPNLWNGERVVAPTSASLIEPQLNTLTNLVQEWGRPNTGQIIEAMEETFGLETSYNPSNGDLQSRLIRVYGVLDTFDGRIDPNRRRLHPSYWGKVRRDYELAAVILRNRQSLSDPDVSEYSGAEEALIDDAVGYLVPGAVVATKAGLPRERMDYPMYEWRDSPFLNQMLEPESRAMMQTSQDVGSLLDMLTENRVINRSEPIDYAAAAQGAWKAVELEINFSLIQAARKCRGVVMPDYFTLYDPNLPREKAKVKTNGGRPRDINQEEKRLPNVSRHVFLPMGDSRRVVEKLLQQREDGLDQLILHIRGSQLPGAFFSRWAEIADIRNRGSHSHLFRRSEYLETMPIVVDSRFIEVLYSFKQALRQ